jgi:hypothetical protein
MSSHPSWLRLVRTPPLHGTTLRADVPGEPRGARQDLNTAPEPTPQERAVMAAHGIRFDGRGYRFAGYRHERLVDAVQQSRRAGQGCE